MNEHRICVIGSPGAGKSTVADQLAVATGLPLTRLDDVYWRAGWARPTDAEWFAAVDDLVAADRWILDGNHAGSIAPRLERATLVLFLDLSPWRCCYRILKRTVRLRLNGRGHLPAAIAANRDRPYDRLGPLLRKAATFRRSIRPTLVAALDEAPGQVVMAHRPAEVRLALATVTAAVLGPPIPGAHPIR